MINTDPKQLRQYMIVLFSDKNICCQFSCLSITSIQDPWLSWIMPVYIVDEVTDLIEKQFGAKLYFLPPYSPDLMPAEGVFSQVKSIMKNHKLFQVCTAPRALLAMAFGMVSIENCYGHISRCGYV